MISIILSFFAVFFFLLLGVALFFYYSLALISLIQSSIGGAPFVPLEREVAERMLEIAEPKAGEIVYDLGCGDARHLILSYFRYKTKGIGIEIAWWPMLKAWYLRRLFFLQKEIKLHWGNFKKYNFEEADIVFVYLFESLLGQLKEKFSTELKPGTRIVSARYRIPGWEPKLTVEDTCHPIYLYVVT